MYISILFCSFAIYFAFVSFHLFAFPSVIHLFSFPHSLANPHPWLETGCDSSFGVCVCVSEYVVGTILFVVRAVTHGLQEAKMNMADGVLMVCCIPAQRHPVFLMCERDLRQACYNPADHLFDTQISSLLSATTL